MCCDPFMFKYVLDHNPQFIGDDEDDDLNMKIASSKRSD